MIISKKILKKTIPIIAFLSQSCSPSPEPANKLKEYTLKNKFLYENFRELMEKRSYLSSKDALSNVWFDREKYCASLARKYEGAENLVITFKDYGIDGLTENDAIINSLGQTIFLRKLSPDERLSQAEIYTDEIKKLIQENKNKD